MSSGLRFEINLLIRNFEQQNNRSPKFLIVDHDMRMTLRKIMMTEGSRPYTLPPNENETYNGLILAVVNANSTLEVA